jgi:hypothetical protein
MDKKRTSLKMLVLLEGWNFRGNHVVGTGKALFQHSFSREGRREVSVRGAFYVV